MRGISGLWARALVVTTVALMGAAGCDGEGGGEAKRWSVVAEGLDEALLAVHGTSSTDVWAVGADRGQGPLVLRYDGQAWTRLETGTQGDLWWVHAVPEGPVFLAGGNGTVLRYEDGVFTREATPGVAAHTVYGMWARAADDVYAVGSVAGRDGFIWRYDGQAWRNVDLPATTELGPTGSLPGFFKVWGDDDETFVVGGHGRMFRLGDDGSLERVGEGATSSTLFTVHSAGGPFVAVGGASGGVIVEGEHTTVVEATPQGCPLLQGVCVTEDGQGYATGFQGTIYRRDGPGQWSEVDHGLELAVESLHAVWIDDRGGVWSVGGNVVTSRLNEGALVHYPGASGGAKVPTYVPPPPEDKPTPKVECPAGQIDPVPNGSIARRWNEANLNAIRRAIPRPGVHARNLFHTSVAMYDAWAAWDEVADGYLVTDKAAPAADLDAARREAISYAAYRVLTHRYTIENGGAVSLACFDALMDELGYDPADTAATGDSPRAVGNRIGAAVVAAFAEDGANEAANYADTTGYVFVNPPLVVDQPGTKLNDPSLWQPLNLAVAVTQNGIITDAGVQGYIGANWGHVAPFAMERPAEGAPYFDLGEGPVFDEAMVPHVVELIEKSALLDPRDSELVDLSPGVYGNNPLGTNDGQGHGLNPVTGQAYAPNPMPLNDFARVIAEVWADGPQSETPPGHWVKIGNEVSDTPGFERRLWGEGPELPRLEWDVKLYLAVAGAVHDAAIAAWEAKRNYNSARPISLVRYMGGLGQRTTPALPGYDPDGLPLVDGLIELVTEETAAPGGRHAHLAPYLGEVVVRSWRGEPGDRDAEFGGVGWIRAVDWIPYQRRTFVSPAFPGFVSGHSTFSRAGAEVLTEITGSPYFPGGLGEWVAKANQYLVFEAGPSVDVHLQWASYYDAADQAGQSRLWGGIHIAPDDFEGRKIGSVVGKQAAALARTYFEGSAHP